MNNILRYREEIDQAIASISFQKTPVELYQPVEYILNLGGRL